MKEGFKYRIWGGCPVGTGGATTFSFFDLDLERARLGFRAERGEVVKRPVVGGRGLK